MPVGCFRVRVARQLSVCELVAEEEAAAAQPMNEAGGVRDELSSRSEVDELPSLKQEAAAGDDDAADDDDDADDAADAADAEERILDTVSWARQRDLDISCDMSCSPPNACLVLSSKLAWFNCNQQYTSEAAADR